MNTFSKASRWGCGNLPLFASFISEKVPELRFRNLRVTAFSALLTTIATINQYGQKPMYRFQSVDQAGAGSSWRYRRKDSQNGETGNAQFRKLIDLTMRVAQKDARVWIASSIPRHRLAIS